MNAPLIDRGIYTVSDAARLLRASPQKVRGWVAGYPRTRVEPIIKNDVGWLEGSLAFSFANLMEVRFIQYFAGFGVRVASIRQMAIEARELLRHPHPFATRTVFQTDGKKIFASIAEETGDEKLYDLQSKNWAMLEMIAQSLDEEVKYDPSGDAASWHPRPQFSNVVVNPRYSFGKPIVEGYGVPTRALYEAFQAEGESVDSVATWYELPTEIVRTAVRFELELAKAH
jgi:uncharacterized protein (DUF433 family)